MTKARDNANLDGLDLITSATIGSAVSSVTVSNCFSSAYEAYKVIITGGAGSTGASIKLQLGSSTSTYNYIYFGVNSSGTADIGRVASTTSFAESGSCNTNYISVNLDLINPFLSKYTQLFSGTAGNGANGFNSYGFHGTASSYTDFTLTPTSGTLTGGTIQVYGYRK